ncbi:MAG: DMT family transporter [Pseudomonadota bacterium]
MTDPSRVWLAVVWMLGATLSFSTMAVAGREATRELDTFELMLFRSLIGIVVVSVAIALFGSRRDLSTDRMGLHVGRNIAHFTGQNLWFFAISLAPLAQVISLEFTSPLWVALMAPLLLGERLTLLRLIAIGLGIAGIVIVADPGRLELTPGVVAAAFSAIAFALTTIATKRLTRTTSTLNILFWLTIMQALFGLVTAGYDGEIALPSREMLLPVLAVSLAGLSAHFCLTQAMQIAPASVVAPLDFLRLPLIAVVGLVLYNEPLEQAVFLGGAIIIVANLINLRADGRRQNVT